eukprot:15455427-Alexandrium_andersonii.AAC.1
MLVRPCDARANHGEPRIRAALQEKCAREHTASGLSQTAATEAPLGPQGRDGGIRVEFLAQ